MMMMMMMMMTVMMVVNLQAHVAIAECESRLKEQGRRVVVITQNIDSLHARAGSNNIIELHGKFFLFVCYNSDIIQCCSVRS